MHSRTETRYSKGDTFLQSSDNSVVVSRAALCSAQQQQHLTHNCKDRKLKIIIATNINIHVAIVY